MSAQLPPIVISPVLRDAAELKIEELHRAKALFKSRYDLDFNVDTAVSVVDVLVRLSALLEQVKELDPYLERDDDLLTLTRLVEQAQNDRSISRVKLVRLERQLRDKLDKHVNRLEVSALHFELLKEVLDASEQGGGKIEEKMGSAALEDEFEMVENEVEIVFERFEKSTFATKEVDDKAIELYLESLFDNDAAKEQLKVMRTAIEDYGADVLQSCEEVDADMVIWCIEDLLKNEFVSEEKKKTLQGYLQSPLAIKELKSTLNMKSVRHWTFRNAEKGLPVTARQNFEGKYIIVIEEDIVDMLFLHSLSVGWSMKLKEVLKEAVSFKGVWPGNKLLSAEELEEREYWLQETRWKPSSCAQAMPPPPPPMPPMPPSPRSPPGPPPRVINTYSPPPPRRRCPPPPPPHMYIPVQAPLSKKKHNALRPHNIRRRGPPMPGTPNLNDLRYKDFTRSFFLSRLPERFGCTPESIDERETQALLLKVLTAEAKLRLAFDGEVHGLVAQFEPPAEAMPHSTILAVLKFIGVPKQWLSMFERFLKAPLNMGPVVRGTDDQVLTRTSGVSAGHGMEAFFSEAVLFFLDLAVHQRTNAYLYRLRSACFFVGKEQQLLPINAEVGQFAKVMGLDIFVREMIDEPIGFVKLTAFKEVVTHTLDNSRIDAHARRVKKQLASCSTVIEWIRTWNATLGSYAAHLFGPLAHVFGKSHLDDVTQAYNRMLEVNFDGGDLTFHVMSLLNKHLERPLSDPPFSLEALIYLPHAYGGLGIKNPYITLNLAHNIHADPNSVLKAFKEGEAKYYQRAKGNFERMTPTAQAEKLSNIFNNDKERTFRVLGDSTDPTIFPSLSVVTESRERAAYPYLPPPPYPETSSYTPTPNLIEAYDALMNEPVDHIMASDKVLDEVCHLAGKLEMKRWYQMSGEDQWVLQLYWDECFERYGGLAAWHGESVPRELLRVVRGEEVDVVDDGSSLSCLSEA